MKNVSPARKQDQNVAAKHKADEKYHAEIAKSQERSRKRQVRRKIREQLLALQAEGEQCESGQVIEFISEFLQDIELLREVVHEEAHHFSGVGDTTFVLQILQQYIAHGSMEKLSQQIAEYKLSKQLAQFMEQVKEVLSDPLVLLVSVSDQGPDLDAVTSQKIHQHILSLLGTVVHDFTIEGEFPFPRIDDYPLKLVFPLGYQMDCTLRLQADNMLQPYDLKDFQVAPLLPLPETKAVLEALQEDYTQLLAIKETAQQNAIFEYISHLGSLLITAYHYGYGQSRLVQDVLHEWRSTREDYALALGLRDIRAILQRHHTVILSQNIEGISLEVVLEAARDFYAQNSSLSYDVDFRYDGDLTDAVLPVEVWWRGISVGEINVHQSQALSSHDPEGTWLASQNSKHLLQVLHQALKKVLPLPDSSKQTALTSRAVEDFQTFAQSLARDLVQVKIQQADIATSPNTASQWFEDAKSYRHRKHKDRAEHFWLLARIYAEQDNESLLRCSLAEYCFGRGNQYYHEIRVDARPYLQLFLFLNDHMSRQERHNYVWSRYRTLSLYFSAYGFNVEPMAGSATEIAENFHNAFLNALPALHGQRQLEQAGYCLVNLAIANSSLIFELIDDVKKSHEQQCLQVMIRALQGMHVLRAEQFYCLRLLVHIDQHTGLNAVPSTMARVSLNTVEERRQIAIALLQLADAIPNIPMSSFTAQVSEEVKNTLAFSLLIEPFIFHTTQSVDESKLKARLVVELLGLPLANENIPYFIARAADLALLLNRFSESQDLKSSIGITIQETIRNARKRSTERLPGEYGDRVYQLLKRIESHVTAELARQVHDTWLEIRLVSDRALYVQGNTLITVEIRNAGGALAENLELEVQPQTGQYDIEEQHKIYKIEMSDKTALVQTEISIRPLVGINEKIDLAIALYYDTLKQKNKQAKLRPGENSIWLYAASEFRRIPQPYNIGDPATNWFYGRQEHLESIADNLRPGPKHDSSMIIYGLKRAGKTSIIKRFIDHTLGERQLGQSHVPIYIDLQKHPRAKNIKTNEDFLYFLMEAIVKSLTRDGYPTSITLSGDTFRADAFEQFIVTLELITEAIGDRHLLIVLDEFSTLYSILSTDGASEGLTPYLFSFLSNMTQHNSQLTFILIGTYVLMEMMRDPVRDLAKICIPRMISFLDEQSARQLIEKPVMRQENSYLGWLDYDPHAVDYIVTYTHSHPYLIQYICSMLVERMNNAKHNFVTINDAMALFNDIVIKPAYERSMLTFWDEFDPLQQKILAIIAAQARDIQTPVDINILAKTFKDFGEQISMYQIRQFCSSLADAEMLERSTITTEEAYSITIPLYQMWLKQNKPVRAVFDEPFSD
ncbi:hypothetical protein [Reticulibacter mediterranei]|nr:hypothetical protein [Reticulibacter mediterranei]